MVLYDITDDAKVVKVTTPALRPERFFERDDHRCYVVTVPHTAEHAVSEAERLRTFKALDFQ